jgi:hypothetical protein
MKTIIKCLLAISLLWCLKLPAQSQPSDRLPLADKSSLKGKKELRKEMKIKRASDRNAKKQERKAIKKHKVSKYTVGKSKRPKLKKNREKKGKGDSPKEKSEERT